MREDAASFVRELDTLIRARYPLIHLVSSEEHRVDRFLRDLAATHGKELVTWSITRGLRKVSGARAIAPTEGTQDPVQALQSIEKLSEPALVVFKDFHPFLNDPTVVRATRELGHHLKATFTTVVFVSAALQIPPELEKEIEVLDVPLPTAADLRVLLRDIIRAVRQGNKATIDLTAESAEALIKAALGLTLNEAENAYAKAIANDGRLDASDVRLVLEEKKQVIRKSGLLEYFPHDESFGSIGGLEHLKLWLTQRGAAFTDAAREFGLPEPKGALLLGVQGCGKSLTAKAIAAHWSLPLLRLDVGRIFSGIVGSSEENLRKAIRVAESVAPAVLWIDEIEKGLAGSVGSGMTDSGVSARVFGALLTWLQEKKAPVFVVATANRIDALPPELLRKGRFDEIFFINLPRASEREEIFRIHLQRRKRDPNAFDCAKLSKLASEFSGAEIEQAVVSALYDAFAENGALTEAHLERAIGATVPLATTMKEEITRLREWAKRRTRPASPAPEDDAIEPALEVGSRFS